MALTKVSYSLINGAPANVLDYGADPTGVADSATAINAAISANGAVYIPFGTYRCDTSIVIQSVYQNQKIVVMEGATLVRKAAAASTSPVVKLLGSYGVFDANGGFVISEKDSPTGVVVLGHENHTTSNYNAVYWTFKNVQIIGNVTSANAGSFTAYQSVGVYIPSSQPNIGSSAVNYFGVVENVHCSGVTAGLWMTDGVNGHTLYNYRTRGFSHFGIILNGAYGNTIYGGFMEVNYLDSKIGIKLDTKLYPAAPFASTLQSMYNQIAGFNMEFSGVSMQGLNISALCQGNNVTFNWNAVGTAIVDNDGFNNIIESREQLFTRVGTSRLTGVGSAAQTVDIFPFDAGFTNTGMGMTVSAGQGVYPKADDTTPLGIVSKRWSVVYAGTGTINTSDEREKQDFKDLSDAERQAALGIKAIIKSFKFKNAIAKKGDNARIHFGVSAQQVGEIFKTVGLNPDNYGLFCYDEWENEAAVIDKDGNIIKEEVKAGNRYGIRYEELLAFVIAAL
jgi:hypothetical protein